MLGGKFKKARAQVLISEQGREYRVAVQSSVIEQHVPRGAVKGRLAVSIVAHPPDRRTRDLDNLLKGSLDGLKHAGVISDDGDIDALEVRRGSVREGGRLDVAVAEITGAELRDTVDMFHHREQQTRRVLDTVNDLLKPPF